MGSLGEDDEDCRFFDAHEDIASVPECSGATSSSLSVGNWEFSFEQDMWTRSPQSVKERRSRFLSWMGLNLDRSGPEKFRSVYDNPLSSEAVSGTSGLEDEFSANSLDLSRESVSNICRMSNSNHGTEYRIAVLEQESRQNALLREDSKSASELPSSIQRPKQIDTEVAGNLRRVVSRVKNRWLSRLRSVTCILDRQGVADSLRTNGSKVSKGAKVQRIKVRQYGKQCKELSALYMGQDIQAHEGSILTMKFSLDGRYLATAGEDGIVRVWQVVEDLRSNETDIPDIDSSCIYFTVNHLSELVPFIVNKEKVGKLKSLSKTAGSACVIFPPKVFRILEKPLHQFHGHGADILDLSWSKNNYLLSSSVDKTVRLWQVGVDQCLKVFPHGNYVTCIQFDPVNDNYFISGSIDGKVRIWEITSCHVVDWTDTRDIVTAVCFHPDGQGVVVGSITGTCRFYNIADDHFQLESKICLDSKKKVPSKRITGFQFFPQDPSKVMVTCADSQVRILNGSSVIGKYRGLRSTGSQISASFASDGMHIVSTCEDSNVYLWNCINQEELMLSQPKVVRSWERFSSNASVAIPWLGLKSGNMEHGWQLNVPNETCPNKLPFPSPAYFSLGPEFILESYPKVSATWPEEKLPYSSPRAMASALRKSQYKFLKTSCQSTSSSHAWGLVIVTAGRDGRIRSFHNYGLPVPL